MTDVGLVVRYIAFAIVAVVANLTAQRVVLSFQDGNHGVVAAIFVGTLVGLVVKYLLDKRWIFGDTRTGAAIHGKLFFLYTLMGVSTTVIFWGSEYSFWLIWQTDLMREVGAVLGLAVGYVVKYNLDKRFVFKSTRTVPADGI